MRRGARDQHADPWDEYMGYREEWKEEEEETDTDGARGVAYEAPDPRRRNRARSRARPLKARDGDGDLDSFGSYDDMRLASLSTESVPELMAYRPSRPPARRVPAYTQALVRTASNPWSVVRAICAVLAISVTLWTGLTLVGEPSQPLMSFDTNVGAASAGKIASQVPVFTQMRRPDLYDSVAQFNAWSGAACSAAVSAAILTAWGVPKMTIGRVIDEMGSYISPNGGLLSYAGFDRVAAKHGFRGEFRDNLTYAQMLYITNTLGLPLIVSVRISYGYYHFLSGGHLLAMVGGDSQGIRLVDSSLYYIKYLPKSVFYSMFTGRTELLVPKDYSYSL